jgi:hypothetical protein
MRAYGLGAGEYREDREFGATSKHRKMTGKNRKSARRCLHKSARNSAKCVIRLQIGE